MRPESFLKDGLKEQKGFQPALLEKTEDQRRHRGNFERPFPSQRSQAVGLFVLSLLITLFYLSLNLTPVEAQQAGRKLQYKYDKLRRLIEVRDSAGNITTYTYDIRSNRASSATTGKPVIAAVQPAGATVGTTLSVTLLGRNFIGATVTTSSDKVGVSNVSVRIGVRLSSITFTATIAPDTPVGPIEIIVTNNLGQASIQFFIRPKVLVQPESVTLPLEGSITFTAVVQGTSDQRVQWSVDGGAANGTISSDGTYRAPSTPGTFTVRAVSLFDPLAQGTATVVVSPFRTPTLQSVTPNELVPGEVSDGQIQGSHLESITAVVFPSGDITAEILPGRTGQSLPVRFTVARTASPGPKFFQIVYPLGTIASGSIVVNVSLPVVERIEPGRIAPGRTVDAVLFGQRLRTVTQVTFSGTGVTAQILPGRTDTSLPVRITALETAETGDRTLQITYSGGDLMIQGVILRVLRVLVTVSPKTGQVVVGGSLSLLAQVQFATVDSGVLWSVVSGPGSVTPEGVYHPGDRVDNTPQQAVVRATSREDNLSFDEATITVLPVSVSLTPQPPPSKPALILRPGERELFTAVVDNVATGLGKVLWRLEGPATGAQLTDITDNTVILLAPSEISQPVQISLVAQSIADQAKEAGVLVELRPHITVAITPGPEVTVLAGGQQSFSAEVTFADNPQVSWQVSSGPGVIDSNGLYQTGIPVSTPASALIRAVSVEDPDRFAEVRVNIPTVSVVVTPEFVFLPAGASQEFTAVLTDSSPGADLLWELPQGAGTLNLQAGTRDAQGVFTQRASYTAPAEVGDQLLALLTVRSVADPSKEALVQILVVPPLSLSVDRVVVPPGAEVLLPVRLMASQITLLPTMSLDLSLVPPQGAPSAVVTQVVTDATTLLSVVDTFPEVIPQEGVSQLVTAFFQPEDPLVSPVGILFYLKVRVPDSAPLGTLYQVNLSNAVVVDMEAEVIPVNLLMGSILVSQESNQGVKGQG